MSVRSYYETYWSPEGFNPCSELKPSLVRLVEPHLAPDQRCLDFGCGDGRSKGSWLKGLVGTYVGVDVSQNAVDEARSRGIEALRIEEGASLPFDDNSFDVAVAFDVFEHLFEPQKAAVEISRVLRPGAALLAQVPNIAYWRRRLDLAVFSRWDPMGDDQAVTAPWRDPHVRFFTRSSLRRMLEQSGFAPVSVTGFGGGFLRDIPLLRGLVRTVDGGRVYQRLERAVPSLLGHSLLAAAHKP